MRIGKLLDDYGRRFHEAKIAGGKHGTEERANAARRALVKAFERKNGPNPSRGSK